jgi:hypothetical protein
VDVGSTLAAPRVLAGWRRLRALLVRAHHFTRATSRPPRSLSRARSLAPAFPPPGRERRRRRSRPGNGPRPPGKRRPHPGPAFR